MSPLSSLCRLEVLSLSNNPLVSDLAPLAACTSLRRLNLAHCSSVQSLGPLEHCKQVNVWKCVGGGHRKIDVARWQEMS